MVLSNKKFVIRDTGKYGKGVFALKDIKKGEVIWVLDGDRMDVKEEAERVGSGKTYIDDPLQIGKRTYIILNETSRSFNHSCNPNSGIRKNSELFAIRDIKKGEQITYDYSLTIAPTKWNMKCKCGEKICRKILGDIRSVPKRRREEYRKLGALQIYMKKLLKDLDAGTYVIPKYEIESLEKIAHN